MDIFISFEREIQENMKGSLKSRQNEFKSKFCEWIRVLVSLSTDYQFDKVLEDPVGHVTKLLISMNPGTCSLDSKHLESINERYFFYMLQYQIIYLS